MTHSEIKSTFSLVTKEKGAELYLQVGAMNKATKKANYTWWMISGQTGTHTINSNSNKIDSRVRSHWKGFKRNQKD